MHTAHTLNRPFDFLSHIGRSPRRSLCYAARVCDSAVHHIEPRVIEADAIALVTDDTGWHEYACLQIECNRFAVTPCYTGTTGYQEEISRIGQRDVALSALGDAHSGSSHITGFIHHKVLERERKLLVVQSEQIWDIRACKTAFADHVKLRLGGFRCGHSNIRGIRMNLQSGT